MSADIKALAEHCGIAAAYHDIWGSLHATSTYTHQMLLAAMHFPPAAVAGDPASLLAEMAAREWRDPLPPVTVTHVGEPVRIALVLPVADSTRRWRWRVTLENGIPQAAAFIPAELPRLAERDGLVRFELELPPVAVAGYHRLDLHDDLHDAMASHAMPLIVAPPQCHQPEAIRDDGRIWGLTVQLYGVRSRRNWGIGDFTDLASLIEFTARAGGQIVGVNPLHAMFPDNPGHISPYSPSHRGFVNVLYIDVEAVPERAACQAARRRLASADFQERLRALRDAPMVDYVGVAAAKFEILKLLFAQFQADRGARAAAFAAWRSAQGEELEHHAEYEALQAHFRAGNENIWGWPLWPEEYRDPASPAVAAFVAEHAVEVTWHAWLQWLADTQMAAVAARAQALGMAAGIYQDLAVGTCPGGAEAWHWQDVLASGAHAGAPPDEINLMGQDWGLPPCVPHLLREAAYAPFIDILRANMKHAGALRIDHVMGLMRVFWVPEGIPATQGAYVHYPFEDMLGILALESQRNQCLVIGEDLGTVPEGFRPRLAECGVLSYHPLIFERYPDGNFTLPADMQRQSLVAVSTHDLPTLRGYWHGEDLVIREALHLFPSEEMRQRMYTERDWDRGRLLWALERENLLPAGVSKDPAAMPDISNKTVMAIQAYLARSPAQILVVQPEDVLGVMEQPNLPGTLEDQHPNWQRKLPLPLEEWPAADSFQRCFNALRAERT